MSKPTFSLAEEEFITALMDQFGIGRIEATNQVIKYKTDLLYHYNQVGNEKMVEQLKKELGL